MWLEGRFPRKFSPRSKCNKSAQKSNPQSINPQPKVSGFHGTLTVPFHTLLIQAPDSLSGAQPHCSSNQQYDVTKPPHPTLVSSQWILVSEPSCAIITEVPIRGSLVPWAAVATGDFTLLPRLSIEQLKSLVPRAKSMCPPTHILYWSCTAIHEWHPCWATGTWSSSPELLSQSSALYEQSQRCQADFGNRISVFRPRDMRLARLSDASFVTPVEELESLVLEKKASKSSG